MRIIYSRKQAQAAVEFVNKNNPFLRKPLTMRQVCENVLTAWIDSSKSLLDGVVFTYHEETFGEIYCVISVSPAYFDSIEESVPYEIELTEEHFEMQMEADIRQLKKYGQDVGVEVVTADDLGIEDGSSTEEALGMIDEYVSSKNKKVLH